MGSKFLCMSSATALVATLLGWSAAGQVATAAAPPIADTAIAGTPIVASPMGAARAAAVTPIALTDSGGEMPHVAVDAEGTAHVAWLQESDDIDQVAYCRLPRGAAACEDTTTLPGIVDDGSVLSVFGKPQVLLPDDGRVLVLGGFCCGGIDADLVMWSSADGGATFDGPKRIGTQVPESAVFGPSDNAVTIGFSGSSSPPGAGVQIAEIDAAEEDREEAYAILGEPDQDEFYSGGVALLDALTPISAYTDLGDTYLRAFDATRPTADLNDGSAWLPPLEVPGESDPTLVSGAAGAYLMTYYNFSGDILDGAYRIRRITADDTAPSGLRLSDPVLGSDPGDSLFGDLTADAGDAAGNDGGLTSVWTDTGDTAAIKTAYAPGGGQFRSPGTLVRGARAYNLDVATAGDGGGAVVWDENSDGAVWLAPIPVGGVPSDEEPTPTHDGGFTPPGNTAKCTTSLTVRPGVVAAVRGGKCWEQAGGQAWTTKGDVNVNGIDFITDKTSTSVRVDLGSDKLTATAGVLQKAGSLVFAKDTGTWDLGGTTVFEGVEKANIKLFDFPVMGRASVVFGDGKAEITANLGLPDPFDTFSGLPVTVQTVLTTTQKKGLILTGIVARAQQLSVGGFGVRDLRITYDAGLTEFVGQARLQLAGGEVEIGLGFRQGKLTKLFFTYLDGSPFPIQVYKGIWLNGVGFGYDGTDGFSLAGGGHLSFPVPTSVVPEPPIAFDGIGSPPGTGGGVVFRRANGVTSLSVAATLEIFGFEVGHSSAYVDSTGVLTFESDFALGWERLGLRGHLAGGVDADAGTWQAHATGEACLLLCASMQAAASDNGIGACAEIDLWLTSIGITVGYFWAGGLYASFGCDLGPFLAPPAPGQAGPGQVSVASDGTVTLPANLSDGPRSYVIDIPGTGGSVPLVTVRDGGGSVVLASDPAAPEEPQQNEPYVLTPSPATGSTRLLVVKKPDLVPTVLRIEASPQSAVGLRRIPVRRADSDERAAGDVAVTVAEIVGETEVEAVVGGAGRARNLDYVATHLEDGARSVTFVETAADGSIQEIGTVEEETGSLPFQPVDGPKGERRIDAVVINSDGVPVSTTPVATYQAPGWVVPGRASKVSIRHSKRTLTVSWKTPSGPAKPQRWQVFVRLASGEGLLIETARPTVKVRTPVARQKVLVAIVGLDRFGRMGPTVSARK